MNFAKRLLIMVGVVALAVTFGGLLAPKTTHAVVATLVDVVNDSARPVPTLDVDSPAAQPYEKEMCSEIFTNSCGTLPQNFLVPDLAGNAAVKRLVIEYASGECSGPGNPVAVELKIANNFINGDPSSDNFFVPIFAGSNTYNFAGSTRIYANPGALVLFDVGAAGGGASCTLQINGYLTTQ